MCPSVISTRGDFGFYYLFLFKQILMWHLPCARHCFKGFTNISFILVIGSVDGTVVKNLPANAGDPGDMGLISGSERFPGVGNGNPLQHPCLESSMDKRAWRATVHGVTKSQAQLGTHTLYLKGPGLQREIVGKGGGLSWGFLEVGQRQPH